MSSVHYMEKEWAKDRLWSMNLARQFMQSLKGRNPLKYEDVFFAASYPGGPYGPTINFAATFKDHLWNYLMRNLGREKLLRLAFSAPGANVKGVTPMSEFTHEASLKFDSGEMMIWEMATLSLLAVCYDLCHAKHPVR